MMWKFHSVTFLIFMITPDVFIRVYTRYAGILPSSKMVYGNNISINKEIDIPEQETKRFGNIYA